MFNYFDNFILHNFSIFIKDLLGFQGRRDVFAQQTKKRKLSMSDVLITPPKLTGDKSFNLDSSHHVCAIEFNTPPGSPAECISKGSCNTIDRLGEVSSASPVSLSESSGTISDSKIDESLASSSNGAMTRETSVDSAIVESLPTTPDSNEVTSDSRNEGSLDSTSNEAMSLSTAADSLIDGSLSFSTKEIDDDTHLEDDNRQEDKHIITLESSTKRVIYSLKLSDDNFDKLLEENLNLLQKLYSEELKVSVFS